MFHTALLFIAKILKRTLVSFFYRTVDKYPGDHNIIIYWNAAVVQLLSCIWLFTIPWTAACQVLLSFTISWSLLKFMFIESVVLTISSSASLFSFCFQYCPAPEPFPMSQLFPSGGQSTGASSSALECYITIKTASCNNMGKSQKYIAD